MLHSQPNNSSYIRLKSAREHLLASLFTLDRDIANMTTMRDQMLVSASTSRSRRKTAEDKELEADFIQFFSESAKIRRHLTDYLKLFDTVTDN